MRLPAAAICLFLTFPGLSKAEGPGPSVLDATMSRWVTYQNQRLHSKSFGYGEPALVFVHGFATDMTFFREQVPAFQKRIRTVLVDLPGHGRSDKPFRGYSLEIFARSLDAMLTDAGVGKAILVGQGMGMPVARTYARLFPAKVAALVALDGPLWPFAVTPAERAAALAPWNAPTYKQALGRLADDAFPKGSTAPSWVRAQVRETLLATPLTVATGAMEAQLDPAAWKEEKVTVPLLVFVPATARFTKADEARLKTLAPGAEVLRVAGAGPFLMLEKPDAVNAPLLDFLSRHGFLRAVR
ncbi:MAG: alpha/beta hydrolase [Acidobacteria bacterium]|nr:alpha/beta hydrolase [Acidobacteriota bacterium]